MLSMRLTDNKSVTRQQENGKPMSRGHSPGVMEKDEASSHWLMKLSPTSKALMGGCQLSKVRSRLVGEACKASLRTRELITLHVRAYAWSYIYIYAHIDSVEKQHGQQQEGRERKKGETPEPPHKDRHTVRCELNKCMPEADVQPPI